MIKILDRYYYLMLSRDWEGLHGWPIGAMSLTIGINFYTVLLFCFGWYNVDNLLWICYFAISLICFVLLVIRYTPKRVVQIKEKYKKESEQIRAKGKFYMILYILGSFAALAETFYLFLPAR